MSNKTELQREILITAQRNPHATQSEIADMCNCSASYVSNVLSRFDHWDAMDAEIEQMNRELGYNPGRGLGATPSQEPAWSSSGFADGEGVSDEDVAAFIDDSIEAVQTVSGEPTDMSTGEAFVALVQLAIVIGVLLFIAYYAVFVF